MPPYFEEGFMVREPAWHGLGVVLDDYPGREEGMKLAGHNFEVVERPVLMAAPQIVAATYTDDLDGTGPYIVTEDGVSLAAPVEGFKCLVKSMPGDPTDGQVMTITNETYGVVQNSTGWDIIDLLVGEGIKYETGLTLKGGAICSVLAYLDEPYTIPGDNSAILPYVNVSWSHDGSSAVSARPTSIRTVCWNTQSAAEMQGQRNNNEFIFRHSSKVLERIEDAKLAMQGIRGEHEALIALSTELAEIKVTEEQRELFVCQMVPMPAEALISDRVKANIEDARTTLRLLFSDGNQSISEEHKLTGFGLQCAGVEFLDHLRGYRSRDTLFGRQLLRNEPAKAKMVELIREVATA